MPRTETAGQVAGRLERAVRAGPDELKLIPYVMAGYPDALAAVALGRAYAGRGAAAVEVGVPYSDPLADGPVIQRAGQVALANGTTMVQALRTAAAVAEEGAPVVVMTYINPLLAYGLHRFAADVARAQVAGVIVPDLPVEEAGPLSEALRSAGVDTVFLVAPTSPQERVRRITELSTGFVYCVTLAGVTGPRDQLAPGLESLLARVRGATSLPVAAGFGISRPEQLRRLRGRADAAVVASALLDRVHRGLDPLALFEELREGCR